MVYQTVNKFIEDEVWPAALAKQGYSCYMHLDCRIAVKDATLVGFYPTRRSLLAGWELGS